ncbi:MAG: glycosyltransferase [Chitinivibrionales bacterium]|nr:glycosyltransferase [Chitinivibrionales bacterium]
MAVQKHVQDDTMTIAYIITRFPAITETFILYEMKMLESMGCSIELFPLIKENTDTMHPEAVSFFKKMHYVSLFSLKTLSAQFFWLFSRPVEYMQIWLYSFMYNLTSPKFLSRIFYVIPKAAYFARKMDELAIPHAHGHYAAHPGLAVYCINKLTQATCSITMHAHDIFVERPMLRQKLASAKMLITISNFNRQYIGHLLGNEVMNKIHIVRCGVDLQLFQPRMQRSKGSVPVLICVASFKEYKGHKYLFEACAMLKQEGIKCRCRLVGDGVLRKQLHEDVIHLKIDDIVEFAGELPREKVLAELENATVFVLPSVIARTGKMEGIPVALMEAMAMKLPVVATAISGIPEILVNNKNGILIREKNSRELCRAVMSLIADVEYAARLGESARATIEQDYDQKKNVAALYRLFEMNLEKAKHQPVPEV